MAVALVIALGGGGDAIAASILAGSISNQFVPCVIVSLAWERLIKDPLPGPRRVGELREVIAVGDRIVRVCNDSSFPNGARLNQAALFEAFPSQIHYIIDPYDGICGLAAALRELASLHDFDQIWGLDVGGDVLAEAPMPSLRSPLADALMLGALSEVYPSSNVLVTGIGLDGEIPHEIMQNALSSHFATGLIRALHVMNMQSVIDMIPLLDDRRIDTEMTGMFIRAHQGMRGRVVVRDHRSVVEVDSYSLLGIVYKAEAIFKFINPLPKQLVGVPTLELASRTAESLGYVSELTIETAKASRVSIAYPEDESDNMLGLVLQAIESLTGAGVKADYVAERSIADYLRVGIKSIRMAVDKLARLGEVRSLPPFVTVRFRKC